MTKFEQLGINYQMESANKRDAIKNFENSCNICCYHGIHIDCDHCTIAAAHHMVVAAFETGH